MGAKSSERVWVSARAASASARNSELLRGQAAHNAAHSQQDQRSRS